MPTNSKKETKLSGMVTLKRALRRERCRRISSEHKLPEWLVILKVDLLEEARRLRFGSRQKRKRVPSGGSHQSNKKKSC